MRTLRAAVALLAALVPLAPGTARAGDPAGLACGLSVFEDPREPDGNVAVLEAGPLVLDADPAGQPVWGSITCTLQLAPNLRHGDADLASATSAVTPGVVALAPTPVPYQADPATDLLLCAQLDVVGVGTRYWDEDAEGWSTDPATPCDFALAAPYEPGPDPIAEYVDPVVCPPLATVAPPDGDVPFVWDCPPYN